ncbi:MAG: hypothetical protein DRG83_01080 [Deltaproteobacteria bacterium]|nr:MAG: hypothetical protein DRG83_01080 [Deltaproteobacteria bacterium]RLF12991.1 MAG: hypothetical protein DRJ69_00055 [Thermoprotei archaeon]
MDSITSLVSKARSAYHRALTMSRFGTHVGITMGTNIALMLLGLATGALAARLLGPTGRGELAAIKVWPTAIATIAMLGMPEALVYFSGRFPNQAGRYLSSSIALILVTCPLFIAAGYWAMPILLSAQPDWVVYAARWYLLIIPINAFVGMASHPLRGRSDFAVWNALRLGPPIGWLTLLVVAMILKLSSPILLAAGYLAILFFYAFAKFYVVTRRIPGPFRPDPSKWGGLLRYGLPCMFTTMPQLLNLRLDQMLMATLLPPRNLGLYVVAVAWSNGLRPLLSALGTVLFPKVASISEESARKETLAQGSRLGVVAAGTVAVPMMVVTPIFIPLLFGRDFTAAVPAALVLVAASAVLSFNIILEEGLRGLGYPKAVMWAEILGFIVTGALLALLLRPLGIMGAAIASLSAYSIVAIFLLIQAVHLTGLSLRRFLCPVPQEILTAWRQVKRMVSLGGQLK